MPLQTRKLQLFAFLVSCMMLFSSAHAQFSQPGELDTTFNFGGVPLSFFRSSDPQLGIGSNDVVHCIAAQVDNKVLIGGDFSTYNGVTRNRIARLNVDGTVDTSFNPGTGPDGRVTAIGVQSDGKYVISGFFSNCSGVARNGLARLNSNGSLDTSFNPGVGVNGTIQTIALQANGKIIIGGSFSGYGGVARNNIARVNTDGTVDTTFNPGSGTNNTVGSLVIQADGKIVMGGAFTRVQGIFCNGTARLNPNGNLDGTYIHGFGSTTSVLKIALQPDGKVVVVDLVSVFRKNTNGSLDTTFNTGTGANNSVKSVAVQADGKILLGGSFSSFNGISRNRFVRLNSNGSVDGTFGNLTSIGSEIGLVTALQNGKSLICSSPAANGNLVRLNSNGTKDITFNQAAGLSSEPRSFVAQPDGKILVVGTFTFSNGASRRYIERFNMDGSTDTSFLIGTGANGIINDFAFQPDGKIILGGEFTSYNGNPRNRIARLNSDGTIDPTFQPGQGANNRITSLSIQADGKIIIGGDFTSFGGFTRNRVARLLTNGSVDASFNPISGANSLVNEVLIQQDGKVLITGAFSSYDGMPANQIARLDTVGRIDLSFNIGTATGSYISPADLILQPNGKLLVGGHFTQFNGVNRSYIVRLNTDGSVDTTFNATGVVNGVVRSLAIQDDGKIIVGGFRNSMGGFQFDGILRLDSNGALDPTFVPSTNINNIVLNFAVQPNGKLLVGGRFTRFNTVYRPRIARLILQNCSSSVSNTTSPDTICIGNTKNLIGTLGADWVIASGPGTIVRSTYFATGGGGLVSVYSRLGICSSPTVTFFVDAPATPQLRDTVVCAGNSVRLTPDSGGASYRFYADSTSTNPLAGGNNVSSFTTPILTTTTTFYVSAVSASGCEGTARRAVTVRVNALPSVSISRNGDTLVATTAAGNYQWFRDGNAIVGANTIRYRATESGVYTVAVTDTVGCTGVSNSINVIFAGIESDSQNQNLRWNTYPVPFTSELILQAEASFSYQLLDIRGAVLLQGRSEGVQATLNTSELASGIYFVRITVNGQSAMRKLVKE